jgi:hypothetical protein
MCDICESKLTPCEQDCDGFCDICTLPEVFKSIHGTGLYNFCPICGKPLTDPKPLTLEELRAREGKPVWVKVDDEVFCAEMSYVTDFCVSLWLFGNEVLKDLYIDQQGKTWQMFDYEPINNDFVDTNKTMCSR